MDGKRIAILGSTGSIGRSALQVIEHLGAPWCATAITGHTQLDSLIEQAKRAGSAAVGVADEACRGEVESRLREAGLRAKVYAGERELCDLVRRDDVDVVLAAIVGFAGLAPVLAAVEAGMRVALANKESLVVAGSLLMPLARKTGAQIIPVDSEHSAIFQAMACGRGLHEVNRVILTASGGPFRSGTVERMNNATPSEALDHPTWQMGKKVSIDSATMFNKALEIIEASWLFDLPAEKIEVVVHPESVVHSMVEFTDGSTIAQLSPADMRTAIQYALTYPARTTGAAPRMDWSRAQSLHFEPPDPDKFGRALRLAYDVVRKRGTSGAVLNAANEIAVKRFLDGQCQFGMIAEVVERTIARHRLTPLPTQDDLIEADRWARESADECINSMTGSR